MSETPGRMFTASFLTLGLMVWVFAPSWRLGETVVAVFFGSSFQSLNVWNVPRSDGRTHVKGLKDLMKARPPGVDCLSIFPRVEISGHSIPFTPLDQPPLNICRRPAVESSLVESSRQTSVVELTTSIGLSPHHELIELVHFFSFVA